MKAALFALFLACAGALAFGTELPSRAYFILPEGRSYRGIGFFTADPDGVRLRFADELSLMEESLHGSMSWFLCSRDGAFFRLPESHVTKVPRGTVYGSDGNLPIGREITDPAHPLSIHYEPNDLEVLPSKYSAEGYEERVLLLRKEAREKFIALIENAEKAGINVRILSSYRSARYQSVLYENSIKEYGVFQNRVAKPGHSEHQLGTTCDLTSEEIRNGLSWEFETTEAFQWLMENGHRFGIFLSYPRYSESITGYIYEPWHFRYFGAHRWEIPGEERRIFLSR